MILLNKFIENIPIYFTNHTYWNAIHINVNKNPYELLIVITCVSSPFNLDSWTIKRKKKGAQANHITIRIESHDTRGACACVDIISGNRYRTIWLDTLKPTIDDIVKDYRDWVH